MKLISCSSYVLNFEAKEEYPIYTPIWSYAKFLKKPLELGFFVPTDKEGNVLEKPKFPKGERKAYDGLAELFEFQLKEYQEAQQRVIFEGISWDNGIGDTLNIYLDEVYKVTYQRKLKKYPARFVWSHKTIEDLCNLGLEIKEEQVKILGI